MPGRAGGEPGAQLDNPSPAFCAQAEPAAATESEAAPYDKNDLLFIGFPSADAPTPVTGSLH